VGGDGGCCWVCGVFVVGGWGMGDENGGRF
jgi:hypothetical protein